MKLPRFLLSALLAGSASLVGHAQNLLTNGTFETWSGGAPTGWTASGTSAIYQATGLGSGNAIVVQNGSFITQAVSPKPLDFNLSFTFTLNQTASLSGFSQSFIISLYQTPVLNVSNDSWISLRFQTNNASNAPFSLSVYNGTAWQSLTDAVFSASTLNSGNASFSTTNAYQFSLAYNDAANTYSISYGAVGGSLTTLDNQAGYRNATAHTGLSGLQLFANNNGFGLDNVSVSAIPEPQSVCLLLAACAGACVLVKRRRRQE